MSVGPLHSLMWLYKILEGTVSLKCLDTSQIQSGRNIASFTQLCAKIINLSSPDCSGYAAILALTSASLGNSALYSTLWSKFTLSVWLQGNCRYLHFQYTSKTNIMCIQHIVSWAFPEKDKIKQQYFSDLTVLIFRNLHFNELNFCGTL